MYEEYWGLSEPPFENTPDPRFLYYSAQHEEGLMRLVYAVKERKGAAMLTGVFGCGKTLLGRALLGELEKDIYRIAFVTNPRLQDIDLLRMIGTHLGGEDMPMNKTDVLNRLNEVLINNMRDGKNTVVIVDEAHSIEDRNVFEELRLLLNFQLEDRFLLTLLLFGQPELKKQIDTNKQLSQRIALRYHLESLGKEETSEYIIHRLKVANQTNSIFTEEAIKLIYDRSGGIPRRINQICDMGLFTGFVKKRERIDEDVVKEAVESLEG